MCYIPFVLIVGFSSSRPVWKCESAPRLFRPIQVAVEIRASLTGFPQRRHFPQATHLPVSTHRFCRGPEKRTKKERKLQPVETAAADGNPQKGFPQRLENSLGDSAFSQFPQARRRVKHQPISTAAIHLKIRDFLSEEWGAPHFANEIVCECVAIGAFEDEASGRRHEPKSERAREVRKSALMAVSLGPRRHGGNRDQGFGHRYAVEMIPNEILYRGRDHFAGPQDLKHIWEERGKADRDSPGSWDGVGGLNRGENAEAVAATGTSSTSMANTRRINWDQE